MHTKKITNLKDLVKFYGGKKSDVEIAYMLDVPINTIRATNAKKTNK
ncbi:hypothetical protein RH915_06945 [Serpentinicella sp. ANB-PHB4]|nr:hypothetical protein [Serpentinicella sp. ANB-PHB4]MDR5659223.1 hypothetical protein [Serpentinicella sp. ANB-PHB4]